MLKAKVTKYILIFKQAGGTSRGILHQKPSWFIKLFEFENPGIFGIGECSIIPGLSPDDKTVLDDFIGQVAENINFYLENPEELSQWPAIQFALETAKLDLKTGGKRILYPNEFSNGNAGIPINGLIWMGTKGFMRSQIREKIEEGFNCIKLKIGAINFDDEIEILKEIRKNYKAETIELRLDANGAFHRNNALKKLNELSKYDIHSIEQPIKAGQIEEMAELCKHSPIPIALDEELIGLQDFETKLNLLKRIKPRYIILKPSLLGGIKKSEGWIKMANDYQIGWWVTSALESNIGLNAIAQWTYQLKNDMPQGLGTGKIFSNNLASPLIIKNAQLYHDQKLQWDLNNKGL